MGNLRDSVHIGRYSAVLRNLSELLLVERDVVICANWRVLGRPLLHLVGADIHRLDELPLEPARGAVGCESALRGADSRDSTSHRSQGTVTGSARFLVVDAEVRVVREEVELVTKALDHGAGQVARIGQGIIMESFIDYGERTV